MRSIAILLFGAMLLQADPMLDSKTAERFAKLALACVHREYPNKIAHVMNSDADAKPPRELTPAFYGCYDWHSSVHGHWLLVRVARLFPQTPFAREARLALDKSLTAENLKREALYLQGEGRGTFERPYGLAWLLQLAAELREWKSASDWSANLKPLEDAAVQRMTVWLKKLSHPVRSGEHSNTAFALGLALDYSRFNPEFRALLTAKSREFYLNDKTCPLAYEPSGEDFLSPCLAEADLMRRVLPKPEFAAWLHEFLPGDPAAWMKPALVTDPSDGKLAHLDGLNLSRAWMLEGIDSGLPSSDARILALAKLHAQDGLKAVTGEHYEGGHWLGTFAVYLLTKKGTGRLP